MSIERYKTDPQKPETIFYRYKSQPAEIYVPFNNRRFELLNPSTLVIYNVTEADEFVYRCKYNIMKTGQLVPEKSSIQLKIYGK